MKKLICIVLCLTFLIFVCGCSDIAENSTVASDSNATEDHFTTQSKNNISDNSSEASSKTSSVGSSTQNNVSNEITDTSSKENAASQSRTVYKTPTGKRYHFDPDCGGKNSTATTLDHAKELSLTPCLKCAQ